MSSATTNPSLSRSRSLRVPAPGNFKPTSDTVTSAGPSNIALFLTNLRLLDLDLRDDWPDISALTFSTKDAQQNQKKRIQSVEWALFQLFALWNPEETRNKLQPFFPPLEQLQSLNLRAALFRSLDQAKKNGFLGRDTVLRKTMLDECKGERLEEVLSVFSNVVLKKVLEQDSSNDYSIARRLAQENLSYTGERTLLSALIIAHKASLGKLLREKHGKSAQYHDFANLLDLNERRIARRHEQLKEILDGRSLDDAGVRVNVDKVQLTAQRGWSGNEQWLETLLHGDQHVSHYGLLATRFDKVWGHVEVGSIGEIESHDQGSLTKQLDARVKDQELRLARWQAFRQTLGLNDHSSPQKKAVAPQSTGKKINLGFNRHQDLQLGRHTKPQSAEKLTPLIDEHSTLIENMRAELAAVGKPRPASKVSSEHSLLPSTSRDSTTKSNGPKKVSIVESPAPLQNAGDDEWSSVSEDEEPVMSSAKDAPISASRTPSADAASVDDPILVSQPSFEDKEPIPFGGPVSLKQEVVIAVSERTSPIDEVPLSPVAMDCLSSAPNVQQSRKPAARIDYEAELANEILQSMSATSPSPKKRHTLSLAERTRLSMSRTSLSQISDLHDKFEITDMPRLSLKSRPSVAKQAPEDPDTQKHADLIERTRKSMAGFEAAQKKAQLERRRSIKDEKKKQRQSSYFPKVEEEPLTPDVNAIEMLEADPDCESVFKSRPKIKTSPAVSPTRIWEDERED